MTTSLTATLAASLARERAVGGSGDIVLLQSELPVHRSRDRRDLMRLMSGLSTLLPLLEDGTYVGRLIREIVNPVRLSNTSEVIYDASNGETRTYVLEAESREQRSEPSSLR